VAELCDRALWLRQGQVVAYGEPEVVTGQFTTEMQTQTQQRTPNRPPQLSSSGMELRVNENRFGSLEAEILAVRLLPSTIESGEALGVEIVYQLPESIETPVFSVSISHEDGRVCFDSNTANSELILNREGRGTLTLQIDRLDLSGGQYFVDVGLYPQDWAYAYDYHWHVYPLEVRSAIFSKGLLNSPHRWKAARPTMTYRNNYR
jgi:lipopolysaccharide transport system ATP-binding protein